MSAVSPDAAEFRVLAEHAAAALEIAEKVERGTATDIDRTTLVCHLYVLTKDIPSALDTLEQREEAGEAEAGATASQSLVEEASFSVRLAQRFHEVYESLAPAFKYETRPESAVPWEKVPEQNRRLMIAVCAAIEADLRAHLLSGLEEALNTSDCEAVAPDSASDCACSRPSVEALEAERDAATCEFGCGPTGEEYVTPGFGIVPACPVHGWVCFLLDRAEAGRDQAIKERDEAREALEEALPTEAEIRRLIEHAHGYAGNSPRTFWRQHGQHIETIAFRLQNRRRSALAGVPGGGQEAEQEENLGGGTAASSKGEKA